MINNLIVKNESEVHRSHVAGALNNHSCSWSCLEYGKRRGKKRSRKLEKKIPSLEMVEREEKRK